MAQKLTYEELEQRVNELEKEKEKNTRIEKEFVKRQKYLESVLQNAPSAIEKTELRSRSLHPAPRSL